MSAKHKKVIFFKKLILLGHRVIQDAAFTREITVCIKDLIKGRDFNFF